MRKIFNLLFLLFIFIIPQISLEYWGNAKYGFGIILIIYILHFVVSKKHLINGKTILYPSLFLIYALFTIILSENNDKGIWIFRLLTLLLVTVSFSFYFNNYSNLYTFFKGYYLGVIFAAFQIIYVFFFAPQSLIVEGRANILGIDSNESSILLSVGFVIGLYLYNLTKKKFILFSQLFVIYAIILTFSRTGVISLLFIILFYAWFKLKGIKKYAAISFLIIGFLFILSNLEKPAHNCGLQFLTPTGKLDLSGRDLIWSTGFEIFKESDKKIFGFGIDTFSTELDKKLFGANAHNVFLKILFELGIVGISLFLLMLVHLLVNMRRIIKHSKTPILLFCVLLFSFFTLSWIYTLHIWIFLVLLQRYTALLRFQNQH